MKSEKNDQVTRRKFIQKSALAGTAAGMASIFPVFPASEKKNQTSTSDGRSLVPEMLMNGTVSVSKPSLSPSQLSFRIG
ncbi:MAG: twin-arginine translocation signal domain-containing protein, partial [Prolixibacteraceae bacterium]